MRGKLATAGIAVLVVLAAAIALNERVPQEEGGEDRDSSLVSERVRIREFWQTYRGATAQRIAGRREEAAAEYRRALELNPRHEDALYYYANMQLELGAFEEAEGALRRLVEVNPVSARAHSRLGILYSCPETGDLFNVPAAEREFLR
ncbi:MAG: tetratricopeptide repeat protein, partial [Gemmatimonadales bacterium]